MTQAQAHERLHQQAAADTHERCLKAERRLEVMAETLRKIAALGTNRHDIITAKNYAKRTLAELEKL